MWGGAETVPSCEDRDNANKKAFRNGRRGYASTEDGLLIDVLAVDGDGGIVILLHDGALERGAGEGTLGARVGEDLGVSLPVGAGRGVATHRTRGDGRRGRTSGPRHDGAAEELG